MGYGYDYDRNTSAVFENQRHPMSLSVKVPEGDYKVTVTIGNKQYAGVTVLRAETRHLAVKRMITKKSELHNVTSMLMYGLHTLRFVI